MPLTIGTGRALLGGAKNPLAVGIQAAYTFEGGTGPTLSDVSGNGNTGTWQGTGASGSGVSGTGIIGLGGVFNGTNNYVDLGALRLTDTAGSISLWFKLANVTAQAGLYCWGTTTTGSNFVFALRTASSTGGTPSGGNCYLDLRVLDLGPTSDYELYASTTVLTAGAWYHVLLTGNGTTHTMTINGVAQTVSVITGTNKGTWIGGMSKPTPTHAYLGTEFFLNSVLLPLNGSEDEAYYYNRVLTAADGTTLYNAGAGLRPF